MTDPNRDRLRRGAREGARDDSHEDDTRVSSFVEDLLHTAGRALPDRLVRKALGHFLRLDAATAHTVLDGIDGTPGAVVRTESGELDLILRRLDGAGLRLVPGRNEIAFGYLSLHDAERSLLAPLAFTDPQACDRPVRLHPRGQSAVMEERLLPGGPCRSWLTGLGRWFTMSGIDEGTAIVLRRCGLEDPVFRLEIDETPHRDREVDETRLLDRAEEAIARFGAGPHLLVLVMRRLLLTGLFHEDPPPGPFLTLLAGDARFEVDPGKGLVALSSPLRTSPADPLAREEHRYVARDQTPEIDRGQPSILLCRHCEKSFPDPSPFLLTMDGLELFFGACPNCRRVGSRTCTRTR